MIVHRLLDAFFRTLDAVDAVRDRVDRVLGKEPRPDPWAVDWPPPDATPHRDAAGAGEEAAAEGPDSVEASDAKSDAPKKAASTKKKAAAKKSTSSKKATSKKATSKKTSSKASSKKKAGRKKAKASNRKGSVDRSGKDLNSPRADAVKAKIESEGLAVIAEDADYNGKKVLGRTLWALSVAQLAGESEGLTTNDVSALLSRAADVEVFATNVGRACRDHKDLIETGAPDGRSKRYRLTAAGEKAAAEVATR